jgi:hypothetical protein
MMPSSAKPFSVGVQDGAIVVWAFIDPDELFVRDHRFIVVNTGSDFDLGEYFPLFLGTVTEEGIVWHVFWESTYESF